MSKKGKKKEEQEVKAVNTEVTDNNLESAYYNYDEPVVYETKKPGFFKKLFRGKKKVTTSNDLANPEDNFYGSFGNDSNNVEPSYQEPVMNTPPKETTPPVTQQPVNNQFNNPINNNVNNNQTNNLPNNHFNNTPIFNENIKNDKYLQNFDYTQPFDEEENTSKQPMSKTLISAIFAILIVGGIIFLITRFMSTATEKYYVNIGTTTIAIRPYDGEQITFLTNDSKKTKFTSSDSSIVTVNEFGYVQAKGYKANNDGYMKATITIGTETTNKTIDVYVVPTNMSIPMEDFTVPSNIELNLNEKMLIEISNITPPNNTRQRFDYISKDTNIVDVSGVGVLTGRKKGTTTVEVRNHINKNISKVISVTVK